jgi:hypothetical protein
VSDTPEGEGIVPAGLADRPEMGSEPEHTNGLEPISGDGEAAPVVADSTQPMNDSAREPAVPFLQSLVDAMRKIAEQTRDDAMTQLRAAVAERAAGIRTDTEKRAAELHELVDADLKTVADWEQGEIKRIRDEAASKVSSRNATLEAQIAANVAAGEGAVTAVQARVDAFEAEMTSFFAQLNEIHDPAALASALKRIPQAPSLTDPTPAPAGDTAPSPAAAAAEAAEPEPVSTTTSAVPEPEATPAEPVSEVAAPASAEAAPAPTDESAVEPAPTQPTTAEPVAEAAAAESAAAEVPAEAPVEASGEEATTQVLVTGLTSFGAITSFKQSLERVSGIHRVSLGLGTSGEFIFTAVHSPGFDLSAAIRSFEEAAQFAAANGQLRVTVGSKA